MKRDYDDVVEKLHMMNKARYELETKVSDEVDRNKNLREVLTIKEESLGRRQGEIEDLDKKVLEKDRELESMEIKKAGLEKQFELMKKQL